MPFKASAPGSLMLLGEYAVLHGKPALVCAVDKRITVNLTPRRDHKIEIDSALHGRYSTTLSTLSLEKPFHFVLGTLKHYMPKMRQGCDIEIISDFSDQIGFGSSASVTVATMATLVTWINIKMTPHDMLRQGRSIIRAVQGVGSGADVAASIYGGMVGYQAQPMMAEKLNYLSPIHALYAGFKTPTVEAIAKVQQRFLSHPDVFRQLTNAIGQCAHQGIQFARKSEWQKLGELMTMQQGLMESLGVSEPLLQEMVYDLKQQSTIHGAKISGSGFGDCVVGLGDLQADYIFSGSNQKVLRIPVAMTLQGVQCDKY